MLPEGATCAVHASAPAKRTCTRCGAFACLSCPENPFYPGMCPACSARMAQPASLRSYLAITFSGLSATIYCLPFGIVGAILGHLEVQAIDRGEAPLSGRGYANAARWIGVVTGGLTIAIALIGGVLALISAVD